jgi:putative endonuclease
VDQRPTGNAGEAAAARELEARGFSILARNARVGRLELDVIARQGALIVFCEVKTATASAAIDPGYRLAQSQQQRLRRAAAAWLHANPQRGVTDLRFDAAFVRLDDAEATQLEYFEAAF